jgi:selenocysteine lyase/cysteine desulfurase
VIGAKRKEERLRYLKNYWYEKVKTLPKVVQATSFKPQYSCAIAHVGFEGWKGGDIESRLWDKHKIHTSTFIYEKLNGVRITPNIYTSIKDLDVLVKGLIEISKLDPPTASK